MRGPTRGRSGRRPEFSATFAERQAVFAEWQAVLGQLPPETLLEVTTIFLAGLFALSDSTLPPTIPREARQAAARPGTPLRTLVRRPISSVPIERGVDAVLAHAASAALPHVSSAVASRLAAPRVSGPRGPATRPRGGAAQALGPATRPRGSVAQALGPRATVSQRLNAAFLDLNDTTRPVAKSAIRPPRRPLPKPVAKSVVCPPRRPLPRPPSIGPILAVASGAGSARGCRGHAAAAASRPRSCPPPRRSRRRRALEPAHAESATTGGAASPRSPEDDGRVWSWSCRASC